MSYQTSDCVLEVADVATTAPSRNNRRKMLATALSVFAGVVMIGYVASGSNAVVEPQFTSPGNIMQRAAAIRMQQEQGTFVEPLSTESESSWFSGALMAGAAFALGAVASSVVKKAKSFTSLSTEGTGKSVMPEGKECRICPSILNADLSNLTDECKKMMSAGADFLHLDVMDGHFVPNLTFGAPVVACLSKQMPDAFMDVHLMVSEPEKWVTDMAKGGADMFTFHLEATKDPLALVQQIRDAGMKAGVSVKPGTPVTEVLPIADKVDMVLIMTVEPGFGGQSFMQDMMPKVKVLRDAFPKLDIQVDGGVSPATIDECAKAGANMIVSGSAIVQAPDQQAAISAMRKSVNDAIQA